MRRCIVPVLATDFDFRVNSLNAAIRADWNEQVKSQHKDNYERLVAELAVELGPNDFPRKLKRFQDIGAIPFSILSYHNQFLRQIRNAFVQGASYPALTGACALGERILNHMILDVRDEFQSTPEYAKVEKEDSIQSWQRAISILKAWKILLPEAESEFRKLEALRHRSLHFNSKTYATAESDALKAIKMVSKVIQWQFSAFGLQPWFIKGTRGACFIKEEFESHPFIKAFYLPICPRVGVNYSYSYETGKWILFDFKHYDDKRISDQQFCEDFNNRDPSKLAPTILPVSDGVICYELARKG